MDLLPVVLDLRKLGIRVEIACFSWALSQKLLLHCSDFIDLGIYYQEHCIPDIAENQESDSEIVNETADNLDSTQIEDNEKREEVDYGYC